MNLFYCPEINHSPILVLSEDESSHCIRVLRMNKGDAIFITDGKGIFYEGKIVIDHPKKCSVQIIRSIPDPAKRKFNFSIAIAPTKNIDRFEWFLEKATEIGCDEIIPLACKHSERTVIKKERLNKVLVSAMKQCLKSQLPRLHELQDVQTFISSVKDFGGQKLIGHIPELSGTEFPPQLPQGKPLLSMCKKGEDILIAIGPEGGFTEEEITEAIQNKFTPVSLGNSRLRVETAGMVACSIVNSVNDI